MKKVIFYISIFAMLVFTTSCNKEDSYQTDILIMDDLSSETLTSAKGNNNSSDAPVAIMEGLDGELVVIPGASSKLHRNANGITVNFKTKNLIPGNAYTLWFVVFGENPGPPSSTHAAGHVVGGSGKGNFSGHLSVGDVFDHPNLITVFDNPLTAEVHIALRSHGPVQPAMMPGQIQTIDGGCTSGFPSGPALYPDSDVVGYCANIQVAMHPGN